MMGLRVIFFVFLFVGLCFCAPADETEAKDAKKVTDVGDVKKSSTTSADERGVLAVDQSWDVFFSSSTWNVLASVLGTVFIIGGVGLAGYYFYYLNYYGADHPGGYNPAAAGYPYNAPASYQAAQYYSPMARSLDTGSSWSWPQVLYMISLAQESYEKFDFQTLDCQKKALCELVQKQNDFGETGRKVSSTFSFLDAVEGLPMPAIILTYLKEYRGAINEGKNSGKDCATIYPKCNFSLKEVVAKYQKRAAKA